MKETKFLTFCVGNVTGIVVLMLILALTQSAPRQLITKYQSEAVPLGYGKYVIQTNNFGDGTTPVTKFEWITNSTNSVK